MPREVEGIDLDLRVLPGGDTKPVSRLEAPAFTSTWLLSGSTTSSACAGVTTPATVCTANTPSTGVVVVSAWGAATRSSARAAGVLARQVEPLPDIDQRLGERVGHAGVVIWRGRDAQPLHAARHGRVVDRLDVDSMLGEQEIACRLAVLGIADEDRYDVRLARHDREPGHRKHCLRAHRAVLMLLALPVGTLEMADCCGRGGTNRRRKGCGKNEARRV